jgi:hypothetical protein
LNPAEKEVILFVGVTSLFWDSLGITRPENARKYNKIDIFQRINFVLCEASVACDSIL